MFRNVFRFIRPIRHIHPHYDRFVGWGFLSNVILSAESVLSTHSMLSTMGEASCQTVVSINYIGKDIVGQIGGLWFINKMGKRIDTETRKFSHISMVLQQGALALECGTPLMGISYFLPVAGLANITKNISFTGFGAINAKIIQKLAVDNNIGEIYAKITLLNTIGSTLGMGLGLGIATLIPDHCMRMALLPFLSVARMYTFHKSVDSLI